MSENSKEKLELSDTYLCSTGIKNRDETFDDLCMKDFLKKELDNLESITGTSLDGCFEDFTSLFFHKGRLYFIGSDSLSKLAAQGVKLSNVKDYHGLRAMDNDITKSFLDVRSSYGEIPLGNLVMIVARDKGVVYYSKSGKKIKC